ncbi:hypothetical protein LZ31DRAFT_97198 [Colletotrichum somersetense]|nr:hypothetical protein LZ31DRAFT_97198 [Colletotrichum somersetense]
MKAEGSQEVENEQAKDNNASESQTTRAPPQPLYFPCRLFTLLSYPVAIISFFFLSHPRLSGTLFCITTPTDICHPLPITRVLFTFSVPSRPEQRIRLASSSRTLPNR